MEKDPNVKELNRLKIELNTLRREMNDFTGEARGRLDKIERIITNHWGKPR